MKKIETEVSTYDVETDDGGMAKILEIDLTNELFVRIQSWNEEKVHKEFTELINSKKIKITIEYE